MRKTLIALTALVGLAALVATAGTAQADFPFRRSRGYSPSFCHSGYGHCGYQTYAYAPVVQQIIKPVVVQEVAVPVALLQFPQFSFVNATAFSTGVSVGTVAAPVVPAGFPGVAVAPAGPPPATNQFAAQARPNEVCLSAECMDQLATVLAAKIAGVQAPAGPPAGAMEEPKAGPSEQPPAQAQKDDVGLSQAIVDDFGAKCYQCHSAVAVDRQGGARVGGVKKGGLAIFDENKQFNPTKNGQPLDRAGWAKFHERSTDGSMPASGAENPSPLTPEATAFSRRMAAR